MYLIFPGLLNAARKDCKYLWVDFGGLDNEELNQLGKVLGLDSLAIEDLSTNFTRDKAEFLNDELLFVVSRESFYVEQSNVLRTTNINILLQNHLVITTHSSPVHSLNHVKHIIETRYINRLPSCDFVLYAYLDGIVDLFAVLVQQVEMEAHALDDLVLTLSSGELTDLMSRIGTTSIIILLECRWLTITLGMASRRTVELYETLLSKR